LLASKCVSEEEKKELGKRVEKCGSAYLPHANTIYIREFHMMHAAEDASRFLHHACRGLPLRGPASAFSNGEDAFYTRTLECALAYFGSRVLYPARPPAREAELYELYDRTREDVEQSSDFSFPEFIEMVDFLALHRGYELNPDRYPEPPEPIQIGLQFRAEKLDYCARQLGYMLGTDLYDAYLEGKAKTRFLKKLFLIHLEEPGIAAAAYFAVVRKIRQTRRTR